MALLRDKIIEILENGGSTSQKNLLIDELLGIDAEKIEAGVKSSDPEAYAGKVLHPDGLYTSYEDFYTLYKGLPLKEFDFFVDLGAGYGRSNLLYKILNPKIDVLALEFVPERIRTGKLAAKRNNIESHGFEYANLFHYPLPPADYYFVYLPTGKLFDHIMHELSKIACFRSFTVIAIESHGDLIDTFYRDHKWLRNTSLELKTKSQRHDDEIYLFHSLPASEVKAILEQEKSWIKRALDQLEKWGELKMQDIPDPWKHSILKGLSRYHDYELVVNESDHQWMAATLGLTNGLKHDQYESQYPKRQIKLADIKKILVPRPEFTPWRQYRFANTSVEKMGMVQKLLLLPEPAVEFSGAGRVLLSSI